MSCRSPFVPVDAEMDWHSGSTKRTGCNADLRWPVKIDAETFAWRAREMHLTTLSLVHGFSGLDGGAHPDHNETIDAWMRTPLNLTRLYLDKLPVSPFYAASNHTGFEYLRDHLGYRLELRQAAWPGGSVARVWLGCMSADYY